MPTFVSHALIGAGAYSLVAGDRPGRKLGMACAAALAVLPDIDVVWWGLTTYGAPWGHRGMTHSLAFAVVAGVGAATWLHRRVEFPGGGAGLAWLLAIVTASHGFTDALTDGGRGVAFFAPFDPDRHFLHPRGVPAAPITVNPFNRYVWYVLGAEAVLLWPTALTLWTARRARRWWQAGLLLLALAVSVAGWLGWLGLR